MSGATTAIAVGAMALGTGYSIYSGERAAKKQAAAQAQSLQQSQKAARQADIANNKANQKRANTSSALDAAKQSAKGGQSGTLLTGSQGVDPSSLSLGKSTLLG